MQTSDVDIRFVEEILPNAEKALETVQAAQERDLQTYKDLTDIEGPEEAENYFGVIRSYLKKDIDNGSTVAEYLWNQGKLGTDSRFSHSNHFFEQNEFNHYQEIIQTVENMEHYFMNIEEEEIRDGEHEKGLEAARRWTENIYDSISESFKVV